MFKITKSLIGTSMVAIAIGLSGCSEEHAPVTTDSNKLTPGMEKMKEEMIKNFQTKSLGKTVPAAKKQ